MSCVEPFSVDVPNNGGLLVVEGNVGDKKFSSFVKLSRSSPFGASSIVPVNKAIVLVEGRNGLTVDFEIEKNGRFVPKDTTFLGVVGESYKLRIQLGDNSEYQSSWVELRKAPEVDSVYYEVEEKETSGNNIRGVQFFVDAKDLTNNTRFYKWHMIETWSYIAPFPSELIYLGDDVTMPKEDEDIGDVCYRSATISTINVATSRQLTDDVISKHPLSFVSEGSGKLNQTYSLLVQQSAISEEEFSFLNELKNVSTSNGSLYEQQPDPVVGNISRVDDENKPVLGYFSATSITEKRIFAHGDDLPLEFPQLLCVLDTVSKVSVVDNGFRPPQSNSLFFGIHFAPGSSRVLGYLFSSLPCGDCRSLGGTNIKPDYWED